MDLTLSLIWGISDGAESSPSMGNCSIVKGVGSEWTWTAWKGFGDCRSRAECPLTQVVGEDQHLHIQGSVHRGQWKCSHWCTVSYVHQWFVGHGSYSKWVYLSWCHRWRHHRGHWHWWWATCSGGIEAQVATRHSDHIQRAPRAADADWVDESCCFLVNHSILPLAKQKGGGSSTNTAGRKTHLDESVNKGGDNELSPNNAPSDATSLDNAQGIAIMDHHPNIGQHTSPVTINEPMTQLPSMVSQSMLGLDLLKGLRDKYHWDPVFQAILLRPGNFWNFEVSNEFIYLKEAERKVLCIPKLLTQGHSVREIVIFEAHLLLAHLGVNKMLNYLQDHVWWKDMAANTKAYCETCHTCKTSKPSNQKPYGLLNLVSSHPTTPLPKHLTLSMLMFSRTWTHLCWKGW